MYFLGRFYPFIATLQNFDVGLGVGWLMPAGLYLLEDHPRRILGGNATETINGLSKTELSWMISTHITTFSTLSLIYSVLLKNISPRSQIQILGFFKVIGWAILLFGDVTLFWYIFGRVFFGAGMPVVISGVIYTEEITEAHNRGFFLSLCDTSLNAGVLTAFVLGSCLEFHINLKILFSISLIFWMACFLLPESPIWLKKQGLDDSAIINLKKLRTQNYDFTLELNDIDKYLSKSVKLETSLLSNLRILFSKRHHLKGVILVILLFIFQQLTGICIMMFYSVELIDENSPMDVFSLVVLTGVGCFLGSLLASFLTDRIGRRPLFLVSSAGIVLSLGIIAFYFHIGLFFPWIPIICASANVFFVNLGLGPLPYVLMAELIPYHLRIWGSYCSVTIIGIFAFITSKSFNFLSEHIGEAGVFALYSIINIFIFVFIWKFIPETMATPRHLMEKTIFLKGDEKDLEEQEENLKLDKKYSFKMQK